MKWLKRLYDWVLHWADTPYGVPALFLLAFAEASFFPIPPDVLLIALALGAPRKSFQFAVITVLASITGAFLGYYIGYGLYESIGVKIINFYGIQEQFHMVQQRYTENAFLAISIAGFTPIPYKVFTIAAGVFKVKLLTLFLASIIGRSGRFFLVAGLIFYFGEPIRDFIDKYFNKVVLAFGVLLVGGFVLVKYLF